MGTKSKARRIVNIFTDRKTKKRKSVEFKSGGAHGSGPSYLAPNVPMKRKKEAVK